MSDLEKRIGWLDRFKRLYNGVGNRKLTATALDQMAKDIHRLCDEMAPQDPALYRAVIEAVRADRYLKPSRSSGRGAKTDLSDDDRRQVKKALSEICGLIEGYIAEEDAISGEALSQQATVNALLPFDLDLSWSQRPRAEDEMERPGERPMPATQLEIPILSEIDLEATIRPQMLAPGAQKAVSQKIQPYTGEPSDAGTRSKIARLEAAAAELTAKVECLREERDAARRKAAELQERLQDTVRTCADMEVAYASVQAQLLQANEARESSNAYWEVENRAHSDTRDRLSAAEAARASAEAERDRLQRELDDTRRQWQRDCERLHKLDKAEQDAIEKQILNGARSRT